MQEKKKAGLERDVYTKEQRTIQAFCRIIKSCDNSDQFGRDRYTSQLERSMSCFACTENYRCTVTVTQNM